MCFHCLLRVRFHGPLDDHRDVTGLHALPYSVVLFGGRDTYTAELQVQL